MNNIPHESTAYTDGATEMKIRAIDAVQKLKNWLPEVTAQEGRYQLSLAIRALQELELPEKPEPEPAAESAERRAFQAAWTIRSTGPKISCEEAYENWKHNQQWAEDVCPCCGQLYGCYCHEYPHEDNPLCPGNTANMLAWLESPEGKAVMKQAAEKVAQMSRELREAMKIDPKDLHRPVTI